MIKKFTLSIFLIVLTIRLFAQEVKYRVILFGDAGEMNVRQDIDLKNAAKQVIPQKTTVLYLGDNIYPTGMGLPGSSEQETTQNILKSQFEPMRSMGAAVYFLPGNHDWDKSGPDGLAKIQAQGDYLRAQNDPLLRLIPQNGCPDPVAIPINDKLTIIAYDSEWWLFPFNKQTPTDDCDCHTKDEILVRFETLLEQNKDKVIILASHHPFKSYGPHSGYFTWKDHLFPFTSFSQNLYVPLPIIGSLYPLLRSTMLSPEDLKHPQYKDMIKSVNDVFGDYPNVIYAAGHEHGLQLIKGKQLQIVSGSGSKVSSNKKGKQSLFNAVEQGYVVVDQLNNNDMRFEYFIYGDTGTVKVYSYTKKYQPITQKERNKLKPILADSVWVSVKPEYDSVGKFHRWFFGENYRKEYAQKTKLPVLRVSQMKGGLKATQRGGGNQSRSLRLVDKNGKEYVLRSIEKYPEVLLPPQLRATFAKDIITDNMSSQHPFSALVVPELAKAAGILHADPIIGMVSPDDGLGEFEAAFANTVCLFEEREPAGESDSSPKMDKALTKDNDNTVDGKAWLKARAFDVLLGDWDRHEDQWRWKETKTKDGNSHYTPVPRDRDQVFFSSDGFIQRYTQSSSLLPMMQGYERKLKDINWFLWEGREISSRLTANIDETEWNKIIKEFCASFNDAVFEKALKALPEPSYSLHHDELLAQMKARIADMPKMMNDYYHFFNRIVDIELSDKNEFIQVSDTKEKGLVVKINKITKDGKVKDELFNRTFDPKVTKEIRLYTHNGNDSLLMDNKTSHIKLRIIGGKGNKTFDFANSDGKVRLYGRKDNAIYRGEDQNKIHKILSNDTANVSHVAKDLYSRNSVLLNAGYNYDDGVLFGFIYNRTSPGFRKKPYGNSQTVSLIHSFYTKAYSLKYKGEWIEALGKADILANVQINAPNGTQNFFGLGNETPYDKDAPTEYYRARFSMYKGEGLLRWRRPKSTFSMGPAVQFYHYEPEENGDRFISNYINLHSSDSLTIHDSKQFLGAVFHFVNNTRDNELLPTLGSYVDLKLVAYKGLNSEANSFTQFTAGVSLYKNIDGRKNFVIANRFGGGFTIGQVPFYQTLFIGGEGALQGYRQYRFAGEHSFYNNLELRAKLGELVNYVLPGQVGLLAFYDIGRVWKRGEDSDVWHQGVGGGMYFAPASLTLVSLVAGYSKEGWYPYVSIKFRY
ncbi:BamA/TamA family outer membrane protein [Pedobacter sp. MW01-1-1]|uniref:BamA/TamA family outer membrane protein n=1 Tax=Pedobacter sp. MW01-1-1 TaxID=3383027 RepID=UPI003FF01F23